MNQYGYEPIRFYTVDVDLRVLALMVVTYNFDRAPILHSVFKNFFKDV